MQSHAPLDATRERAQLVLGKILSGTRVQQRDHLLNPDQFGVWKHDRLVRCAQGGVREHVDNACVERRRGCDDIRDALVNGAARHGVELRAGGFLHKSGAGVRLDGAKTKRAIGAHARENHSNGLLPAILGERAKEAIDGMIDSALSGRLPQLEDAVANRQVPVGWNHIHVTRFNVGALVYLFDNQLRHTLQQLDQQCRTRGIKVLDDHERLPAVYGHLAQKGLDGLQATRRRADGDDGERWRFTSDRRPCSRACGTCGVVRHTPRLMEAANASTFATDSGGSAALRRSRARTRSSASASPY